jgi:tetraacyldisaccharide 4'-kinase
VIRFSTVLENSWYQPNWLTLLLVPASLIYAVGLLIYQSLHPLRPRKIEEGLPVIVVGNLTTGGTGKTPLVVWLVKALIGAGYRPAVISRGYGGTGRGSLSVLATTDAALAGDEAVMMAWVLDVPIVVDKDRRRGIAYLRENFDVNVLVSDDGLQNRRFSRWIEVLVLDGTRRLGSGLLLPAGPLREFSSRAKTVDFVVTNGEARQGEIKMTTVLTQCVNLVSGETRTLSEMDKHKFVAVTGIGHARRFFDQLTQAGVRFEPQQFPDHHVFSEDDFTRFGSGGVLMTAKDAVKCRTFARPNWWQVELKVDLPPEFIDGVLHQLSSGAEGAK